MSVGYKTIGPQTSKLLTALYDRGQGTFTLADVQAITGLQPGSAATLIHKAVKRGLITRLQRGLFIVVPPELGSTSEYSGNPYLTARSIAGVPPLFISHGSAMEIHHMLTQPQLGVFATSTKRLHNRIIHGTEYRFILVRSNQFFGTTKHWVTKEQSVDVSDLERTVLDGLRQPEYCGGITDVAKALWMRHGDIHVSKIIDYALRLKIGAVIRRLGYLLELYGLASEPDLARLSTELTSTYVRLDPLLRREGKHLARWRLQINVLPEELTQVRGT